MKDLKQYFSPPGGSDNEVPNENEIISKKRRIKCVSENLEYTSETPTLKKKRKKPSNDYDNQNNFCTKSDKKRKKYSGEKSSKKPRTSKLCETVNILETTENYGEKLTKNNSKEVGILKENSLDTTLESDGKSLDSNNLHNYFNKVDKAPDILLKANILKVEAVVHYPPSEETVKPFKRLKTRLRRRKSIDLRPEYDIITSEEDNSCLQNSKNNISLNGFIETDYNNSEEILTSPESVQETPTFIDDLHGISEANGNGTISVPSRIKHDGTLNSFFKISNRIPDPLVIEISEERKIAKKEFLNSGVPDKMKKQMNKNTDNVLLRPAPFPKHHVRQIDVLSLMWNLKVVNLGLKNNFEHLINLPTWSCIIEPSEKIVNYLDNVESSSSSCKDKKIIKKLKKEISEYPIGKWYSELIKMKNANPYDMWSERYKPKSSLHLIGNSSTVEKLKSWLQMLNTNKNSSKKGNETYCSEDEFQKSDDESEVVIKNAAFLQGPPGSGKTATIYALAEEIGYKILEINSSCNRMGKKILHEFSEALQSHKVETNALNFTGTKKNKTEESRKSFILIEDVDVIFPEYDDGFITTIANLAANSKRPIIFTINEYYPKYLSKIMPYTNFRLNYEILPQNKLGSWIRTVAAAENIFLDETEAVKLVQWANGDIRKLLLQLQLSFANSSKLIFTDNQQVSNLWKKLGAMRIDILNETENTSNLYNLLTVCDILNGSINTECTNDKYFDQPWQTVLKASCEFNQPNDSLDYPSRNILTDMMLILKENIHPSQMENNLFRPKIHSVIPIIEQEVLTPSSVLSHTSVATDYLSSLRIIARSEIKRLEAHSKRNNRYFSYVQTLGITQNTVNISNILSESLNSTF